MVTQTLTDALEETLSVFGSTGAPGEPLTTAEVTDQLDVSRRSTYARLERLADRGLLGTKKAGARGRVWWRPPANDSGDGAGPEPSHGDSADDTTPCRETGESARDCRRTAGEGPHHDEQFRALVEATDEYAIFMLDREGHVTTWNAGAEQIKGYDREEIVGEHISVFYTDDARAADVPEANLAAAIEDGQTIDEGWRVRADGSQFWASVTISAIRDAEGRLQGFAKVTRDMTERREYEQELLAERDFTRQVLETAPASVFVVDAAGDVVESNEKLWRGLGLDPEVDGLSVGDVEIYDESGARVSADERPYVSVFETGEPVSDWRCQIALPSGERRWLSVNVAPITDDAGDVESAVVSAQDVTRLTEQARQLERQRDDVASELADVFTRIDDAFLAIDDDWVITYVNEQAVDIVGLTVEDLLGVRVWDALPEIADGRPRRLGERAMETQEPVQYEYYSEMLDSWFETRVYPSERGQAVYFRDVTDRKEREQELELYEAIVDAIEDGVYVLDEDFHFAMVNDAYAEMTGYDREGLVGTHASQVIADDVWQESDARFAEIVQGTGASASIEADIQRSDGQTLRAESRFTALPGESADAPRKVGVVRDVSDRVQHERELEESRRRYQTLIENFPNGAVALVDEDLRYQTVGGTPVEPSIGTTGDLEGSPLAAVLPPELADVLVPRYEAALDGDESVFEHEVAGDGVYEFRVVPVRDDDGDVFAAMGTSQDVTDHRRRERRLREAKTQLEAAMEAGAVGTWEWHVPEDRFMAGASFARTVGVEPDRARDGVSLEEVISAIHEDDRDRVRRQIDEAVANCGEYEAEYRVRDADGDIRWVVARGRVECDEGGDPVSFPGTVTDITERKRAELALERQRERLAALNNLNAVVRDITDAAVEQSTREEIEAAVCEGLAGTDSYQFAWTGAVDVPSEEVTVRAEAGVDGYLDGVTITVDPDDPRSEGPTGRALRTGEIQTTQDVRADGRHDPWREHVEGYGVRSSAAIPLVHEETIYGVLNVYADRPAAFEGEERAVIGQLGEIVGHAIAAVERKRALMSDEVVELEFRIGDILGAVGLDGSPAGRLDLDATVPIGDGDYLVYGHANADGRETLDAIVGALPHWENARLHEDEGASKFELRITEPPVLSALAALGGSIESARIADGDYHMTLHVPPGADVRQLIDAVRDAYPMAEMLSRRQITRTDDANGRVHRVVDDGLTDRQRTALRAAYHADFFAWPRQTTGVELADALGVAPPTFHQHLRKAEGKVFDSLFADADAAGDAPADQPV